MRKTLILAASIGLIAFALPTVQAGPTEDVPDLPGGPSCASVDKDSSSGGSTASVDHPDDPEDRVQIYAEVTVEDDATDGHYVAVMFDATTCLG